MNDQYSLPVGILLAFTAFLWVMTLESRIEILALNQRITEEERHLSELREEEQALLSCLYVPFDLSEKEETLLSMGMERPHREQLIYTELVLPDSVTVTDRELSLGEKILHLFSLS